APRHTEEHAGIPGDAPQYLVDAAQKRARLSQSYDVTEHNYQGRKPHDDDTPRMASARRRQWPGTGRNNGLTGGGCLRAAEALVETYHPGLQSCDSHSRGDGNPRGARRARLRRIEDRSHRVDAGDYAIDRRGIGRGR